MDITLPDGSLIPDIPDDIDEDELSLMLVENGSPAEEVPGILAVNKQMADPTFLENVGGMLADFGIGTQRATKGLVDLAAVPMPGFLEPYTTDPASEFFERGIEATEWAKPEAYKEAASRTPVKRDEEGNFAGFQAPSWQSVAGITVSSLPQIPSFLRGGGVASKGLKAFKWMKAHPKIAEALGYGIVNAALVAPSQWRETYNEALESGMSDEDARSGADAAALLTAMVSGATGTAGGAIAQKLGAASSSLPGAIGKGFVSEAPFEGLEEAGQSAASDIGMGRQVSGVNALEAGSLGFLGGGVPGAGIAAIEHQARSIANDKALTIEEKLRLLQEAQGTLERKGETSEELNYLETRLREENKLIREENKAILSQAYGVEGRGVPENDIKRNAQWAFDKFNEFGFNIDEYTDALDAEEEADLGYDYDEDAATPAELRQKYLDAGMEQSDIDKAHKFLTSNIGVGTPKTVKRKPIDLEKYQPFIDQLRAKLNDAGLKDVQLSLTHEIENVVEDADGNQIFGVRLNRGQADEDLEGYDADRKFVYDRTPTFALGRFNPATAHIFLSIDEAFKTAKTDEEAANNFIATLNHEKIHALKSFDLFTQKEWDILLNAAKKNPYKDGKTFHQWAEGTYKGKGQLIIEEEAIAELISGKTPIGGLPRNLIGRLKLLISRLKSALTGSGFDTFESILGDIDSGKIGKRARDEIRTYSKIREEGLASATLAVADPNIKGEVDGLNDILKDNLTTNLSEISNEVTGRTNQTYTALKDVSKNIDTIAETLTPELRAIIKGKADSLIQRYNAKAKELGMNIDEPFDQAAWHGTGYTEEIRKLKTKYINTGEGTQMEGWGLYSGQQQKTGEHYLQQEGKLGYSYKGKKINSHELQALYIVNEVYGYVNDLTDTAAVKAAWNKLKTRIDSQHDYKNGMIDGWYNEDYRYTQPHMDAAKKLIDSGEIIDINRDIEKRNTGSIYKIDIPDHIIDAMLDLDKPISQQGRKIQEAAKEIGWDEKIGDFTLTGRQLYNAVENFMESEMPAPQIPADGNYSETISDSAPKRASLWLLARGIPGNKFEDGWSRHKVSKIFYDGVDTDSKSFAYPDDFIFEEEMNVDGLLVEIEQGRTTLDKAIADETAWVLQQAEHGEGNSRILDFLNKIEIKKPEATQNFVNFDENDITILTRNGKAIDQPMDQRRNPEPTGIQPAFEAPDTGYAKKKKSTRDKLKYARWQVQDKLIGLQSIEDKINEAREGRGQAKLSARESAYIGEELSFGRIGDKAKKFNEGELNDLITAIASSNIEIADLDEFLVLRHAIERNQRVRMINPAIGEAGAGELNGRRLTDEYVKEQMSTRFGMTWDEHLGEWRGSNGRGRLLNNIAENHIDKLVKGTLDEALEGELITVADHNTLTGGASLTGGAGKGFYKYYAPLRGFGTDMMSEITEASTKHSKTSGAGGSNSITGKQSQKVKGRTSESYSPTATLIADRERTIARAVKNKDIGGRLYNLVLENPNSEVWELIGPGHPREDFQFDSSYTYVGNHPEIEYGTKKRDITDQVDPDNWVKRVVSHSMETVKDSNNEELIGVKVGGEQFYIDIKDDNLRQSLGNLNPQAANIAIKTMGNINRMLSFVNTTLNPEFVLGNFSRDLQTAIASIVNENLTPGGMLEGTADSSKSLTKKVVKGLGNSGRTFYRNARGKSLSAENQAEIDEFLGAGAKADWFHSRPAEDTRADIQYLVDVAKGTNYFTGDASAKTKSIHTMQAVKGFVEDVNAAVENAVRFSTFKVAKQSLIDGGMTAEEAVEKAASMAKNMTINFNRKGESGNMLNSLYLFFNAQVQGTAVVLRGIAGSKVKQGIVGSITAMGAMMSALHHWAEEDDEDGLEKVEDWQRERNMIIPGAIFGGDNIKIPLPYGYNFFYQLGSNAYMMSAGKMSPEKAGVELFKTMIGSFNPMGAPSGESLAEVGAKMALPTIATPFIESTANRDYFGSPIVKENYDFGTSVPDSHRTFKNSNRVWKWLTQGINKATLGNESESGFIDISPDSISYVIGYALGGAGSFTERALMKPAGNLIAGQDAFDSVNAVPFARKFLHSYSDRPNTEAFYERRDEIGQKMNHLANVRGDERYEYLEKNREYIRFDGVYKMMEKQIKILRKQQKRIDEVIARNPDRGVELAENQQRIQDSIDRLIKRTNEMYEERVGN